MNCSKRLKAWDFFGAPVTLKYRDEGDTINTASGGVASIFVRAVTAYFLIDGIVKLTKNSDDDCGCANGNMLDKIRMLLANSGGLFVALKMIVSFIFEPISQLHYLLLLVPDLFRVKSQTIFKTIKKQKPAKINISLCDTIRIYLDRVCCCGQERNLKSRFIKRGEALAEK